MKTFAVWALCIGLVAVNVSGKAQDGPVYQKIPLDLSAPWTQISWDSILRPYFPMLSEPEVHLHLSYVRQSPGGTHIYLEQVYQDLPVIGHGLKLTLSKENRVVHVLQNLQPAPAYLPEFRPAPSQPRQSLQEGWWVDEGEWKWVIQQEVEVPGKGKQLDLLRAEDRRPLVSFDLNRYWNQAIDTTGRGRVFIPDPLTRAGMFYGDVFEDWEDQHFPIFEQFMDTVLLPGLTYKDGLFHLAGPYVEIKDLAPNDYPPATSPTGDFFYGRDESGFEDVMAYFHIDRFQRYVQRLGFDLYRRPIWVDPHGFATSDQSRFVPDEENPYLLFGEGGVDDAEDADVLIHEYSHALSYAASPETMIGCERKGLDEGYCDYFAAAYSKDLNLFDWENIYNWDMHNPFVPVGRTVASEDKYPLATCNALNINAWGEVWASTLMEIRNEIGDTLMDRIVLQALYGSFNQMTMPDAARVILDADSLLYQGEHAGTMNFFFCQRGIFTGAGCLSVDARPGLPSGRVPGWQVMSQPDRGQLRVSWTSATGLVGQGYGCEILSMTGQRICARKLDTDETLLPFHASPGIYVAVLTRWGIPLDHIKFAHRGN